MPKKAAEPEAKPSVQERAKALLETMEAGKKGRKLDPVKAQKALELAKAAKESGQPVLVSKISESTGISPPAVKRLLKENGYELITRVKRMFGENSYNVVAKQPKQAASGSVLGTALEIIRLFKSLPNAEKAVVMAELKNQ